MHTALGTVPTLRRWPAKTKLYRHPSGVIIQSPFASRGRRWLRKLHRQGRRSRGATPVLLEILILRRRRLCRFQRHSRFWRSVLSARVAPARHFRPQADCQTKLVYTASAHLIFSKLLYSSIGIFLKFDKTAGQRRSVGISCGIKSSARWRATGC